MNAAEIAAKHNAELERMSETTPAATGHNSADAKLKAVIERIETLEEEKKALAEDIREIYSEAKGNGYDVKAIRSIIRLRKQDPDERKMQDAVLDAYKLALGMLD